MSSSPAASSDEPMTRQRIVIRVYNYFGVSAADMATARVRASAILETAGIETRWLDCWFVDGEPANVSSSCAQTLAPNEFMLRILASPKANGPTARVSLGCSMVDFQARTGSLSTVFPDLISVVAGGAGVDLPSLMGRAIAHEIGHLLLGTARHATHGLMRALWSRVELQRDAGEDWLFSLEEAARMRQGIAARTRGRQPTREAAVFSPTGVGPPGQ